MTKTFRQGCQKCCPGVHKITLKRIRFSKKKLSFPRIEQYISAVWQIFSGRFVQTLLYLSAGLIWGTLIFWEIKVFNCFSILSEKYQPFVEKVSAGLSKLPSTWQKELFRTKTIWKKKLFCHLCPTLTKKIRPLAGFFGRILQIAYYLSRGLYWRKNSLLKKRVFPNSFSDMGRKYINFFRKRLLVTCQDCFPSLQRITLSKRLVGKIFKPFIFWHWVDNFLFSSFFSIIWRQGCQNCVLRVL